VKRKRRKEGGERSSRDKRLLSKGHATCHRYSNDFLERDELKGPRRQSWYHPNANQKRGPLGRKGLRGMHPTQGKERKGIAVGKSKSVRNLTSGALI